MDFPFYIEIGHTSFNLHLLFEFLGMFAGFRYFLFLRKRQPDPIQTPHRIWIIVGAALGALLGSRLLGGLEHPDVFFNGGGAVGWLYYYQQKTIVGGLLGGLFVVELTKKIIGESRSSGDLFTGPLLLAMIIGRIGCFLSGIEDGTYGLPSELPWAMDLGDGIRRHPTALYEILFLLLLWMGLKWAARRFALANGSLFKLFMLAYLLFRLWVDGLKPGTAVVWRLVPIQIACILGILYYYRVWTRPGYLLAEQKLRNAENK